ncbi:MAG: hypothetical protein WCO84_05985, partial [bacterium]
MSDFLKHFSGMSGMQKSFLGEAKRKNKTIEQKEATLAAAKSNLKDLDFKLANVKDPNYDYKYQQYMSLVAYIKQLEKEIDSQKFHLGERDADKETLDAVTTELTKKPKLSVNQAAWKTLANASLTGIDQLSSTELQARKSRLLLRKQQLADKFGNPTIAEVKEELAAIKLELADTENEIKTLTDEYIESRRSAKKALPAEATKKEIDLALNSSREAFAEPLATAKRTLGRLKKEQAAWHELQDMLEINPETGMTKIDAAIAALGTEEEPAFDDRTDSAGVRLQKERAENTLARTMGLTKRQRALLSAEKLGLADNTSLVYKQKPDPMTKALSFDDMLINAMNAVVEIPEVQTFKAAIDNCNKLFGEIFRHVQTMNAYNVVAKAEKKLKPLFDKLAGGGRIEMDADLVKICWLFFAGNDAIQKAKASPLFIKALEKLERGKPVNSITLPISQITSTEDIFKSEQVKELFVNINNKVLNEKDPERINAYVNNIIDAPSIIYSGASSTIDENIADTLYYAIINTFGTTADKLKLLKLTGRGNQGNFLTDLAKKQIKKEQIDFEDFFIGKRPLGSKGVKVGKGDKTKLGQQLRAMIKPVKASKTRIVLTEPILSRTVEDLVNTTVSLAMDFSRDTLFTKKITESLAAGITPENLTSLLSEHFDAVIAKFLIAKKDDFRVKRDTQSASEYEEAAKISKTEFQKILDNVSTLQQEDINKLSDVFKASAKEKPSIEKPVVINSSSPDGEALLTYVDNILQACDDYEEDVAHDIEKQNKAITYKAHSQ